LKDDITNNLEPQKPAINSRYMQSGSLRLRWSIHNFKKVDLLKI